MTSIAAIAAATASATTPTSKGVREAAQGFEAIFVRQMLAAARSTDFGGDDLFGGKQDDTFTQMRDERFADIAAKSGAFGIGHQIEAALAQRVGGTAAAPVTPAKKG